MYHKIYGKTLDSTKEKALKYGEIVRIEKVFGHYSITVKLK